MTSMRLRRGQRCDAGRTRWLFVALALVILVGAGGFGAYRLGALDDLLGDSDESALDVEPPERLEFPQARAAQPVLRSARPAPVAKQAAERVVRRALAKRKMGKRAGVAVTGLRPGGPTASVGAGRLAPASTLKNFTALAALKSLGADKRFTTSVVRAQQDGSGPKATLTLVGGGDPLLATKKPRGSDDAYPQPATLAELARRTADELGADGVSRVDLRYDDSLFGGPAISPRWEPDYITSDVATRVSALWVDEGIVARTERRSAEPARDATKVFAEQLRKRGIRVANGVTRKPADDDATEIASVDSPPLAAIVEHLLQTSDNEAAEVVLRQLAIGEQRPPSFTGGTAAMKSVLTSLGVPWSGVRAYDGSGLSRDNRVSLNAELEVLRLAATSPNPDLHAMVAGLPVAGFNGSLVDRFTAGTSADALGIARAKTGTLTGIHAYAGVTTDRNGTPLLFVAIANGVKDKRVLGARTGLDEVAAGLSSCACSR